MWSATRSKAALSISGPSAATPGAPPGPPGFEGGALARARPYRPLIYLAVAVLIAGSPAAPWDLRLQTALGYLGLGFAGILLQGALETRRARPGSSRRRGVLRTAVLALDVAAQGFVLARLGNSYLLLLALPVLVWCFLRGTASGLLAAGLAAVADAALRLGGGPGPTEPVSVLVFHAVALLLLGLFAGLLGSRILLGEARHRQTERDLEQAQLDAESVVAQLSRALLCFDIDGRLTLKNSRAEELLGGLLTLRGGATLQEMLHGSGQRTVVLPLVRHLLDRLAVRSEETGEIWLEGKEGEPRRLPLEVTTSPIVDHRGNARGILVVLSDLTERAAQEAARRRKERLALIGELSAGLAHEIRNSLKPITGSVELLRRSIPSGDARKDSLMEIILRESEALENFVTEFLNFARDKNLEMRLFPLERVLGEEWESLNSLPESPFRLIRPDPSEPPIWVKVDQGALRQVVRNLGINALEAGGGRIDMTYRREGSEAVISLTDHGPGIPEEIRSQVFEPFFTTKPNGTGLGLAIARDLVDRLGGHLTLEPAPGGGTEACIRLPLVAPDSAETESAREPGGERHTSMTSNKAGAGPAGGAEFFPSNARPDAGERAA